jgi:hypothetical protein
MARTARKSSLVLPRIANKRAAYDIRTGRCERAAKIVAKAVVEKPVFVEDADGHLIRQWKPEELQRYTTEEIATALRRRQVVEAEEMLQFVPPSAIKYCETKGWIYKASGGFFHVTRKAAAELELPRTLADGRKIRFLDRGL